MAREGGGVRFQVDVVPAKASVLAMIDPATNRVRFQAKDKRGRQSEWSGWFEITEEPIRLTWAAFWE